ncbi:hypothetical protein FOZ60_004928 [Perkinsus olseni]|uniref:Phosphatidylinositol N-acetylglucosaminyltransferase subunit Q n=1 Tax=Perkinsus olseni TaxID=32597 RepID=A0A7J6NT63_PEROL|nr:hypothetical protein FOZ60_004928 [Perkinsus olseni]
MTSAPPSELHNEALQVYFPSSYLLALPGYLCGERIDADTIYICKAWQALVRFRSELVDRHLQPWICWVDGGPTKRRKRVKPQKEKKSPPLLMLGICEGVALPRVLTGSSACEHRSSIHILVYSPPALGYTYSTRRLDLFRWLYNVDADDDDMQPVVRRAPEWTTGTSGSGRTSRIRHALSPIPEYTPVTQLSSAIERINRGSMNPEGRDNETPLRLSFPARLCGCWCLAFSLTSCLFLGGDELTRDGQSRSGPRKQPTKSRHRWYNYSCFYTQLTYRLRQGLQLPALWREWRESPLSDQNGGSVQGLRLFHAASIIGLDIAVGLTLAAFIQSTPSYFLLPLRRAYFYLNEHMNKNLAKFVGTISLTVVNYWNLLIKYCFAYQDGGGLDYQLDGASEPAAAAAGAGYNFEVVVPLVLACLGACGASVLLAFIIDLLSVVFFHIFFVYVGVTRLWNTNTSNLYTLFLLFRGKKYNILRERVDAHPFDLEQLLLGAVFLALFVFLLPTVFVFYVCFMLLWLAVLLFQLVLWTIIMFFNQFPLYPLVLSVIDTYSLPSGVTIKLMPLQNAASTHGEVCYFNLSSHSLQSSEILEAFLKEMLTILPRESSHWLASVVWGSSLLTMKHRAPNLPNVYRTAEAQRATESRHSRRAREDHDRSPRRDFKGDVSFMSADLFTFN